MKNFNDLVEEIKSIGNILFNIKDINMLRRVIKRLIFVSSLMEPVKTEFIDFSKRRFGKIICSDIDGVILEWNGYKRDMGYLVM